MTIKTSVIAAAVSILLTGSMSGCSKSSEPVPAEVKEHKVAESYIPKFHVGDCFANMKVEEWERRVWVVLKVGKEKYLINTLITLEDEDPTPMGWDMKGVDADELVPCVQNELHRNGQ